MIVSLDWLREYATLQESAEALAERFTMAAIGPRWDDMMQALLQDRAGRA